MPTRSPYTRSARSRKSTRVRGTIMPAPKIPPKGARAERLRSRPGARGQRRPDQAKHLGEVERLRQGWLLGALEKLTDGDSQGVPGDEDEAPRQLRVH